ncbi:hypothetical protein ACH518_00230 (plasmid) [Methylomonas sp. HW2-6]|uniref:hypothetical protein n=1 Tax=Methylomonas sp. HW2-6 TaxID=3376687 RepID=UPI0040410073
MQNPIIEQTSHGNTVRYQRLPSGTCYHEDTPQDVIDLLEEAQGTQRKIRLYYGDPATGQSWFDENDVVGRIGRSSGNIKVPLLIESGEIGGPAILDHCIVRIDSPFRTLYQHPTFRVGDVAIQKGVHVDCPWSVTIDGQVHAGFVNKRRANAFAAFIQGQRFALPVDKHGLIECENDDLPWQVWVNDRQKAAFLSEAEAKRYWHALQ